MPRRKLTKAELAILQQAGRILNRLGASAGGKARAKALPPARRREIAKQAARARWKAKG